MSAGTGSSSSVLFFFSDLCELISLFSLFTLLPALLTDLPPSSIPLSQAYVRMSAPLFCFIGQEFFLTLPQNTKCIILALSRHTVTGGRVMRGSDGN